MENREEPTSRLEKAFPLFRVSGRRSFRQSLAAFGKFRDCRKNDSKLLKMLEGRFFRRISRTSFWNHPSRSK